MCKTWVQSLGWEDPLEEGVATHSSVLAWRIPMERGTWGATVHGVAESQTQLSDFHFFTFTSMLVSTDFHSSPYLLSREPPLFLDIQIPSDTLVAPRSPFPAQISIPSSKHILSATYWAF